MSDLTLKDLRKAMKLIDTQREIIKVCADCYSLERVWIKDHSKCSGDWFEIDKNTGHLISFGVGPESRVTIKKLFTAMSKRKSNPSGTFIVGDYYGVPIIIDSDEVEL